jgi:hypothetical protein
VSFVLGLGTAATWTGGCVADTTPTQVMVWVDGDDVVRERAVALEVNVRGGATVGALDPVFTEVLHANSGRLRWAVAVAVLPANGDATRAFEVQATARDGEGAVLAEGRLRGGFVANERRATTLRLAIDCHAVRCGDGETCAGGRCVDAFVPPEAMPPWSPGDGPVTSGSPAGIDGGAPATGDANSAEPDASAGSVPQGAPCLTDTECAGSPVPGPWSTCSGFLNACDTTGTQSRITSVPTCLAGRCAITTVVETQGCTRAVADGTPCGSGRICCFGSCLASSDPADCRR